MGVKDFLLLEGGRQPLLHGFYSTIDSAFPSWVYLPDTCLLHYPREELPTNLSPAFPFLLNILVLWIVVPFQKLVDPVTILNTSGDISDG